MTYGSIDGSLISLSVRLGKIFVMLYFYLACNRSLEIYGEKGSVALKYHRGGIEMINILIKNKNVHKLL